MTILEAIRSGKKIKRSGWSNWFIAETGQMWSNSDVLAEDWEVDSRPCSWAVPFHNMGTEVCLEYKTCERPGHSFKRMVEMP
jgi:hypothetical protein